MQNIDTSNELQIYRFENGIKLLRPDNKKLSNTGRRSNHTLGSLLELPLGVYFIDANSINRRVNECDANASGYNSAAESIGKVCYGQFTRESAQISLNNDNFVMQSRKLKISEEDITISKNNFHRPTLSIKMPWYDDDNKVIGLFGCSIILGIHPLAESLSVINNLGLLNQTENTTKIVGAEINETYLSRQQLACAKLLLTGLTMKQIAKALNLSPRTVESYVDNLKTKLNCKNKIELILKLSECFESASK